MDPTARRPERSAVPILAIVAQHVEEAVHLKRLRTRLVRASHVRLHDLDRLDERLAAHLDGMATAGACGAELLQELLVQHDGDELFVAAVRAIGAADATALQAVLDLAQGRPASRAGALAAFGWVAPGRLRFVSAELIDSTAPWHREVWLAACAMHGLHPGSALLRRLGDPDPAVRARALRLAGQGGMTGARAACIAALDDRDPRCVGEAARAALLLGDRTEARAALEALSTDATSPCRLAALRLVLKVAPVERARELLAVIAKEPARVRLLIQGVAIAGDPHYVPWLIAQMQDLTLARLAGEAFTFITGLDLAQLDLDRTSPPAIESGPADDPEDNSVAMDEDDSLPWPDRDRIAAWWSTQGARFSAGTRYFMGQPPTPASCLDVLATGLQRQRMAAAEYLTLLTPGTPLFNVAAPARRQQRLLRVARLA